MRHAGTCSSGLSHFLQLRPTFEMCSLRSCLFRFRGPPQFSCSCCCAPLPGPSKPCQTVAGKKAVHAASLICSMGWATMPPASWPSASVAVPRLLRVSRAASTAFCMGQKTRLLGFSQWAREQVGYPCASTRMRPASPRWCPPLCCRAWPSHGMPDSPEDQCHKSQLLRNYK